jgi:DNA helicase HerA-like ATPase
VLLRQVSRLEAEGGDVFYGEPEMETDLLRTAPDGRGIVSVLDLSDMGERPALFSTFPMWVLAELFHALPEVGDPEKPWSSSSSTRRTCPASTRPPRAWGR